MAILYSIFRSLFGQKPSAQKAKPKTIEYISVYANGRLDRLVEVSR